jgi:hypothetical protein
MLLAEPLEVTLRVARVLEGLGVDYLVGGSLASSLHGVPRATQDVDIVAMIRLRHVDEFAAQLSDRFYVDADMVRDAIARLSSFNIIDMTTMMKVDIFVAGRDALQKSEMQRRESYAFDEETTLWLASAEDIVLQKLDWYEKGNRISERQWNDALGVLKVRGASMDLSYLRRWAHELGHDALLTRLLADAGVAES